MTWYQGSSISNGYGEIWCIGKHGWYRAASAWCVTQFRSAHYCDVIMGAIAFQITSLTIVYSTVNSDADQRKHQSSASLAFVRGIHQWPVNSPHKRPVTRKMFPFDDVIMTTTNCPAYHKAWPCYHTLHWHRARLNRPRKYSPVTKACQTTMCVKYIYS